MLRRGWLRKVEPKAPPRRLRFTMTMARRATPTQHRRTASHSSRGRQPCRTDLHRLACEAMRKPAGDDDGDGF